MKYLELITGSLVLLLVVGIVFSLINRHYFTVDIPCYNIYAEFGDVTGINRNSDVKIAGIKIGVIKDIRLNPKSYKARVKLCIYKDIKLPMDSSASITSSSVITNNAKYISIQVGGDSKNLQESGILEYTKSSISLESIVNQFLWKKK